MTEVMVHTPVDESFFPESRFNLLQKSKKTEMSSVKSSEFKENYVHKDTPSENNMESTNRKSDTEVSTVKNAHTSGFKDLKKDNKSRRDRIHKDNASGEDYKILTTKTTLINTTYNLITESTTREIMNMTNNVENASWSNFSERMNESVDKSRVIVQVLKSDHKSKTQNVVEDKSPTPEHPVNHFRDDLCKLLTNSSSRLPKFDEDSTTEDTVITEELNTADTSQSTSSEKSDKKSYVSKARRKRNLNIYFLNGRGFKISDLKCVCDNLRQATPGTLRYLHYIMFSSFGLCGSGLQMLETKKNITGFCGYPFKKSSEQFKKKLSCLLKIPEQMLIAIHRAVFGKTSFSDRSVLVNQLLDFLLMPRKCNEILKKYENRSMDISEEEYTALKESALKGPTVAIVLDKLSEGQIKNISSEYLNGKNETDLDQSVKEDEDTKSENKPIGTVPAFILNGPGTKLKYFSKIANNVRIIPEKSVKMFHYILYGRIEPSIEDCRRNILEFNGFSKCQQEFAAERKAVIKGLNQRELFELSQILCLRAKTNSREVRIKKILKYLHSPSKPVKGRSCFKPKGYLWAVPARSKKAKEGFFPKRKYTKRFIKKNDSLFFKSSEVSFEKQDSILPPTVVPSDYPDEIFCSEGTRLRDFRTICSNIECAAPSDLIELNDLLFMKTCDESDIHQKILDCKKFKFPINSFHYDCRKTLMHYMGFHVLRKIAGLLDIENRDKISNPVDLSSNILKFLMEGKGEKPCNSKSSLSKSVEEDTNPENSSTATSSEIQESDCIVNHESPKNTESECVQANQAVVPRSNNVIIQRLTKAPVQTQELCQSDNNKSLQVNEEERLDPACANYLEDDNLCLRQLIHHPSERELNELIHRIVQANLWDYTLGDLVRKVYECYPKVNLTYRESFIKAAARQVISEWRDYAVSAVTDQSFL